MKQENLQEKISALETDLAAGRIQSRLLQEFVTWADQGEDPEILRSVLQSTLAAAANLAGAQKGSLFLLDEQGRVTDSILSRQDVSEAQRRKLIGKVFDKGLAGWVNRHREIGLIRDTEEDDRWLTLPDQPYSVRSALAVPIASRGNRLLAILILLHAKAKRFDEQTARMMKSTAAQISVVLENVQLYARLEASMKDLDKAKTAAESYSRALDRELQKGRKIQDDFLPDVIPQPEGWHICAHFDPALQVSGDFYDVFALPEGHVALVIADVCDKGVGSALFMALFRSLMRIFSGHTLVSGGGTGREWSPDLALDAVAQANDYILDNHGEEGMFATMFFGVLNPETGTLRYINAGHEPPFVVRDRRVDRLLKASGPSVGLMPGIAYRKNKTVFEKGDIFFGYTDGVSEAMSPDGELFTKARLEALAAGPTDDAVMMMQEIRDGLARHVAGAPQSDDITILIAGRLPDIL